MIKIDKEILEAIAVSGIAVGCIGVLTLLALLMVFLLSLFPYAAGTVFAGAVLFWILWGFWYFFRPR